jgi:serine/threonine protein phosphatase PrpC
MFESSAVTYPANVINEDRFLVKETVALKPGHEMYLFAVVDGHGGPDCATFAPGPLAAAAKASVPCTPTSPTPCARR